MVKKLSFLLCLLCSVSWIQAATFTVSNLNTTSVPGSFARAVADANAAGAGPHTITFTVTGGTISSSSATLYTITNNDITIDATGKTVVFTGAAGVTFGLTIQANNITVKGLTFTNFSSACIRVMAVTGTKIAGCRFGTSTDGASSVNTSIGYGIFANGATDLFIGGSTTADRNYFADASTCAVSVVTCTNAVITGNYFGVNNSGSTLYADKNQNSLLLTDCVNSFVGKNSAGERNLFANATSQEIEIQGFTGYGNTISGNYIGYASNGTTQIAYNNGLLMTNTKNNLIMYNKFGTTYATPLQLTTSWIGNKLTHNSFESHSGGPNISPMYANVTFPVIYSNSSTIIKGKCAPGDSVEIYYANSYAVSGVTFIAATKADATGRWSITGAFTTGKYVSVTATNNTTNTSSWYVTPAVYTIYACANTANAYGSNVCVNPNTPVNGIYPSGSVGTTNPTNAGLWSTTGTGTFSNGGVFNPSITKYYPSAADLSSGAITFTLVTTDTNCVNNTAGSTATSTFITSPAVNAGTDQFSCSSNIFNLNATPTYYGNSGFYTNWTSLDVPANVSFNNTSFDNPTATISAAGKYRLVRSVGSLPYYCSWSDTVVVVYKPTPTAPGGALTTYSQMPVTYTVPSSAVGEVLTAFYYAGSVTPSTSLVTNNLNTITYVSTGTYYGSSNFTYYVKNQCGGTSALGTISVNVRNAPPVALNPAAVSSVRGTQDVIVVNMADYFSDINNDLNFTTVALVTPPASGATVQLNVPTGFMTITYSSSQQASDFVGLDSMRIMVSDYGSSYVSSRVTVDRERNLSNPSKDPNDIEVHNAISPDGDGVNDYMRINFLSDYENTVTIYDRWGSKVWEGKNYDNTTVRFEGNGNVASMSPLPDGTYFFVIKNESKEFNGEKNGLTSGYLVIARQK